MEGGGSKEERSSGCNRGDRTKRSTADVYKQNLDFLNEIFEQMEETSSDSDGIFLLSLHPAIKQLSPPDNMDFTADAQETLERKL
jgi:hypothetical protein